MNANESQAKKDQVYRLLNIGEKIRKGDHYWLSGTGPWAIWEASEDLYIKEDHYPYRRQITSFQDLSIAEESKTYIGGGLGPLTATEAQCEVRVKPEAEYEAKVLHAPHLESFTLEYQKGWRAIFINGDGADWVAFLERRKARDNE